MAAYLIAEVLPELMGSRTAPHAAAEMGRTIDPMRSLREACCDDLVVAFASPHHTDAMMEHLVRSLDQVWTAHKLQRAA